MTEENDDLPRVAPPAVAPERLDLPRSPQPDSSRQCETRDVFGRVLCCHGRPMACLECGEEYAAELNGPAGGAREDAPEKSEQSTGASIGDTQLLADHSVALGFVRELAALSIITINAESERDLILRARAWLHSAKVEGHG